MKPLRALWRGLRATAHVVRGLWIIRTEFGRLTPPQTERVVREWTRRMLLIMGVDPIWLGVMIALNLQTSFLTPPFGFALFYLRGVTPLSVPTSTIYKGVVPFILLQILMLVIAYIFPGLITWLPEQVYGK